MQWIEQLAIPNSLALISTARFGCVASTAADVVEAKRFAMSRQLPFTPLGQASNVIAMPSVQGFVCLLQSTGIELLEQRVDHVIVRVAAGHNWHDLVMTSLDEQWFGLENLALIPGSVGAAPVQNIGAYGQEIAAFVHAVEVIDEAGEMRLLSSQQCRFGYRSSAFQQRPDLTIVAVRLRLWRTPRTVWEFPALRRVLEAGQSTGAPPTPQAIADAVIGIRRSKLPDPQQVPNVGSFFKNPLVSESQARQLSEHIPDLQRFTTDGSVKLSAAQLIDRAGWKDKPAQKVACWHRQPLVLINLGDATALDILAYAEDIRCDIVARYGVQLELEPSVLS